MFFKSHKKSWLCEALGLKDTFELGLMLRVLSFLDSKKLSTTLPLGREGFHGCAVISPNLFKA